MTGVDTRAEVSDFLRTRRARITPEQAGLPVWGRTRRVKGLRREEVAMLAGMSVDYYTRLERGNLAGVSESVLVALADALALDDAERAHLSDLADAANASARRRRRPPARRVRPPVQWLLDRMAVTPAYVRNARTDLLAANALARALYEPIWAMPQPNVSRFVFLSDAASEVFADWEDIAAQCAALLRSLAGRYPHDKGLHDLVGELSTRSAEFARLWAAHDVRLHRNGTKRICHPVVGTMTLTYEALVLAADEGLTLTAYSAEPGSPDAEALDLLARWASAPGAPEAATDAAADA